MNGFPRHAQRLGEKELDEPMMPQHFERHFFADAGELDAVIGRVTHQLEAREFFNHVGRGRGRDGQILRERRRRDVSLFS